MLDTTGFTHLVGPITELAPGQVTLTLGPQHLNVSGRMHGAMMMVVLNAAARSIAKATAPGAQIQLASSDFGFVRPAQVNASVMATAQIVRATRTMLFVQASVTSNAEPLCTASLTFTVDAPACIREASPAGQHPSTGTNLRKPSNLLGQVIGPIHDELAGMVHRDDAIPVLRAVHEAMTQKYADIDVPIRSSLAIGLTFATPVEIGTSFTDEQIKEAVDALFAEAA